MPETNHDMVTLAKELQPNLDREPKPSLLMRTRLTFSDSAQPERSDALFASFLHENGRKKKVFCPYCERKVHKKAQCRKRSRNAKQRKEARPNTFQVNIATVNEFGLSHHQGKNKNLTCRQWLVMVPVRQEVQALVDTAIDLNLIQIDIADHLCLWPVFLTRAVTQAGGILLKTYLVFHERLKITDSFGAHLGARDTLTLVNIKVSFIVGLP